MSKTAILLGASGLVGSELLKLLLENTEYDKVKIFVRTSLSVQHPKLEEIIFDVDSVSNLESQITGDVLFCCLGTTIKVAGSQEAFRKVDYSLPLLFANIAKKNGVEKFLLVSSLGADKSSSNFYLRVKGEVEAALGSIGFKTLIIVRPSMLLGKRKQFRFGELIGKAVMKSLSFVFIGKLRKYKAIEATKVAKAMSILSIQESQGFQIFESDYLQHF